MDVDRDEVLRVLDETGPDKWLPPEEQDAWDAAREAFRAAIKVALPEVKQEPVMWMLDNDPSVTTTDARMLEFWRHNDFKVTPLYAERLEAENRELRAHIEKRANAQDPLTVQLRQRAEAAEVENAKLREALRELVEDLKFAGVHPAIVARIDALLDGGSHG
jgi:hypothetical protein